MQIYFTNKKATFRSPLRFFSNHLISHILVAFLLHTSRFLGHSTHSIIFVLVSFHSSLSLLAPVKSKISTSLTLCSVFQSLALLQVFSDFTSAYTYARDKRQRSQLQRKLLSFLLTVARLSLCSCLCSLTLWQKSR